MFGFGRASCLHVVSAWHFWSVHWIILYTILRDGRDIVLFMLENHLDLSFQNATAWEQRPRYDFLGYLSVRGVITRTSTTAGIWVHVFCIYGPKHSNWPSGRPHPRQWTSSPGAAIPQAVKETGSWGPDCPHHRPGSWWCLSFSLSHRKLSSAGWCYSQRQTIKHAPCTPARKRLIDAALLLNNYSFYFSK